MLGFRSDPTVIGFGGPISTISYSGFGFRSDPRLSGCGGTQTTRITDLASAPVGSNPGHDTNHLVLRFRLSSRSPNKCLPGQDATFTEQVQDGGKAKHSDESWARSHLCRIHDCKLYHRYKSVFPSNTWGRCLIAPPRSSSFTFNQGFSGTAVVYAVGLAAASWGSEPSLPLSIACSRSSRVAVRAPGSG